MEFLQLPGTITVTSSSTVSMVSTSGPPRAFRVFDFAYATTTAAIGSARLYTTLADGNTSLASIVTSVPVATVNNTLLFAHSAVGWRFPTGCFVELAGGASVSMNYMVEFR